MITLGRSAGSERLARLIDSHPSMMLGEAARYADTPQDREDIVQQAALSLIRRSDALRDRTEAQLVAYMRSAVRNTAISALRRRKRQPPQEPLEEELSVSETQQPEAQLLARAGVDAIEAAYGRLIPAHQEIIRIKCFERLDDRAAARLLGIPPDQVRKRLSRARARLRVLLREEGITP